MKSIKYLGFLVFIMTFSLFLSCIETKIPVYKVSFQANGGTPAPSVQDVIQGGKVDEPSFMTKTGHGFGGWYKEASLINLWDFDIDTITGNITLFAKWDTNYYTVDFETNGGNPVSQQNIAHGSKAITPTDINNTGYTFDGWYKEETLLNKWDFSIDTVNKNITLFAKWLENFTVTFETNGGSPKPNQQNLTYGNKVLLPSTLTKTGYGFGGWYKEAEFVNLWDFDNDVISGATILYAKWNPPFLVPGTSFNEKMRWLDVDANVQSGNIYIIEFDSDVSIGTLSLSFNGKNISIALIGIDSRRIITGRVTVGYGVTLIIENNIELRSSTSNITVNSGGNLIMNYGSKITGNGGGLFSPQGGGVYVDSYGSFTMNGGEISGNRASVSGSFLSLGNSISSSGGGVYVNSNGIFTMNGGEISNNISASLAGSSVSNITSLSRGGGVYVHNSGSFIMNDGKIFGNSSSATYTQQSSSGFVSIITSMSYGGGVYVDSYGSFIMNGGEISGNISSASNTFTSPSSSGRTITAGGGVYINNGTFSMNSGEILNNTCIAASESRGGGIFLNGGNFTMYDGIISGNISGSGGGVYVANGFFTMINGDISDNIANSNLTGGNYGGGGVYIAIGTFNMSNGEIYGNTSIINASSSDPYLGFGGGVYINSSIFHKTGGTIFGYTEGDSKSNVVRTGSVIRQGHAIHFNHSNSIYRMGKNSTSGPTDNLSFNGTFNPPTWSGNMDY